MADIVTFEIPNRESVEFEIGELMPYWDKETLKGPKGDDGESSTIAIGTVSAGDTASVTNSGTSSAAVLDFVLPKGDTGADGQDGADGVSPTLSSSKSGKTTTIYYTDKTHTSGTDVLATILDGEDGSGGGSGVFTAVYNTTSYDDISDALSDDMICRVSFADTLLQYCYSYDGSYDTPPTLPVHIFASITGGKFNQYNSTDNVVWGYTAWVDSSDVWHYEVLQSFELPPQAGNTGYFLKTNGTQAAWGQIYINDLLPSQTGNSGKFLSTDGLDPVWATVSAGDSLPSQTGNSGKFLTTNGSAASWAMVDALPSQSGNSGKFLTTNGSSASWANTPTEIPTQTGNSGKFLTTNGSAVSWANAPTELPSQSGNSGKFLKTNGSAVSWASVVTSESDPVFTAALVTSVSSSSTDSQVPSAKLFYDTCGDIESVLTTLLEGTA